MRTIGTCGDQGEGASPSFRIYAGCSPEHKPALASRIPALKSNSYRLITSRQSAIPKSEAVRTGPHRTEARLSAPGGPPQRKAEDRAGGGTSYREMKSQWRAILGRPGAAWPARPGQARRAPMRRQATFLATPAQPFPRSARRQAPLGYPPGHPVAGRGGAGRPWRDAPRCTRAAPPGPPGRLSPASPHNKPSRGSHAPRSRVNPPPWPGCREPARTHRPRPAHNAPPHPHLPCAPPILPGEPRPPGTGTGRRLRPRFPAPASPLCSMRLWSQLREHLPVQGRCAYMGASPTDQNAHANLRIYQRRNTRP